MCKMGGSFSEWRTLVVTRQELELKTVLTCGQSFRWKLIDKAWTGVFAHHAWMLKQEDERILYKILHKDKCVSEEDSETMLKNYFQLEVSLTKLYQEWSANDPKFANLPLHHCQGIRILAQDPIEAIFAFICSANNNISRISRMVEKLCTFYGEKIGYLNGHTYYDFPRVENLQGDEVEAKMRSEAFGYRAKYISGSASLLVSKGGEKWVKDLKALGYPEARRELQSLVGVGRKVADCVCLMGLGFHQAVPVDTHIYKLGKEYLPNLKAKSVTDKVYTEVSDYFRDIHGEYAGWAQSVLFATKLRTFEDWFTKDNHGKKGDVCYD